MLLINFDLFLNVMKDICANGFYLETHCENENKYLCIISNGCERKRILEKFMCQSSGLYLTTIRIIESNNVLDFDLGFRHI